MVKRKLKKAPKPKKPKVETFNSVPFFDTCRYLEKKRPGIEHRIQNWLDDYFGNGLYALFRRPDNDRFSKEFDSDEVKAEKDEIRADFDLIVEEFNLHTSDKSIPQFFMYVSW